MEWQSRPFTLDSSAHVATDIPSMMKPPERDLLYSVAKNYYSGEGCIVDAGIFLGASTACFAQGVANNPRIKKGNDPLIHSFERAIVTPAMKNFPEFAGYQQDTSYEKLLRHTLQPYPRVHLTVGDITQQEWPQDRKIEILFLDVLKSHSIMNKCNEMFMRSLIPGRSLIIQQDYFWPFGWFVNGWTERWQTCFEAIDHAETSMVFRLTKALPKLAYAPFLLHRMSDNEVVAMLSNPKFRGDRLDHMLAQKLVIAHCLYSRGNPLMAASQLREFEEKFLPLSPRDSQITKRMIGDLSRMKAIVRNKVLKDASTRQTAPTTIRPELHEVRATM